MTTKMTRKCIAAATYMVLFTLFPMYVLGSGSSTEFIFGQNYQAINPAEFDIDGNEIAPTHTQTGAFTYELPIIVPPGRNDMQPTLALTYNNQKTDPETWLSIGWSLSIPHIQRLNKTGVENMYDETYFSSSFSGELEPVSLTDNEHGTYHSKRETGSFFTYVYNTDGSWTVTDKAGVVHTLGEDTDSRVDNPDDTTQIYSWYVTETRDQNGNGILYTHTKDQNQLYPESVSYTDHADVAATMNVTFTLTSRDDQLVRFDSGFEVSTDFVIDTITTSADGQWVREYDLDYSKPDNRERYLLSSITETDRAADGTETTLPATTFTYADTTGGWTLDSSYSLPMQFTGNYSGVPRDTGARMFDANGDGLPDFVYSTDSGRDSSGAPTYTGPGHVAINNGDGTGWTQDTEYTVPVGFIYPTSTGTSDLGVRIADVNGDGLQDIIKSYGGSDASGFASDGVYLNDQENKTWTLASGYSLPVDFAYNPGSVSRDTGMRLVDVNGDRLPDIIRSTDSVDPSGGYIYDGPGYVAINNGDGTGWTVDSEYVIPIALARTVNSMNADDLGVQFDDVNGDGLVDILQGTYEGDYGVYINQGLEKTWELDSTYGMNWSWLGYSGSVPYDNGVRLFDANGDRLSDVFAAYTGYLGIYEDSYNSEIHAGDTTGWTEVDADFPVPVGFVQQASGFNMDEGTRFADIDGDGLIDLIKSEGTSAGSDNGVYINDAEPADLLTQINLSSGASMTIVYSAADHDDNDSLPYVMQTVSSITRDDGLGNTTTTTYAYTGGEHYFESIEEQQFAGFHTISETINDRVTIYYYHQGNDADTSTGEQDDSWYHLGSVYRKDIGDTSGVTYLSEFMQFESTDQFVYPSQTTQLLYNSDSTHVDTAMSFTYDTTTGNRLTSTQWGEVTAATDGSFTDIGDDDVTTTWTYATDSEGEIRSAISQETVSDADGVTLRNAYYYYDWLAFDEVSNGNRTTIAQWLADSEYATTTYTYTGTGLVETVTDDNLHTTTTTYDSPALYPATVSDALNYETTYTYDTATGNVTQTTDPNGGTATMTYDGFGRLLTRTVPDPDDVTTSVTLETHTYDDSSTPRCETIVRSLSATESVTTYRYRDGWDRPVQERRGTETSDMYAVNDIAYNSIGLTDYTTLPYTSTDSSWTTPTTDTTYHVSYTYDVLERLTAATTVLGTTTLSYYNRSITVTDPLSHQTEYSYDGFDQLVEVVEDVAGLSATTMYDRDALGQITTIIDANSNLITYTYDQFGRLLSYTLPHTSSAVMIDDWTYTYDGVGNRLTTVTPQGNTITTSYDDLNRPTIIDQDNDITYTYDTCTHGVGKLCQAFVSSGATTAYAYDTHGNIATEEKTISGTTYTTTYAYTWNDQLDSVTYPNGAAMAYAWNAGGRIETITYIPLTGSSTVAVSNVDYAPTGKVSSLTYANGATTTYTYDPAQLLALTEQTTTHSGANVITLGYDYDAGLNQTSRTLTADTLTDVASAFTYDALNRLSTGTLTTETGTSESLSYTYANNGNITYDAQNGSYTYGARHPHAVKKIGTKRFTYDAGGNMLTYDRWTYTWNDQQQITAASTGAKRIEYLYDHEGDRVRRYTTGTGAYLVTVNPNYDVTSTQYLEHLSLPGVGSVATATTNRITNRTTLNYHIVDYQQTHTVNMSSVGTITQFMDHYPFGKQRANVKSGFVDNYGFTGAVYDPESAHLYLGARYYFPTFNRLMSQDPITVDGPHHGGYAKPYNNYLQTAWKTGASDASLSQFKWKESHEWQQLTYEPQRWNTYSYGLNNPLKYADPTGRESSESDESLLSNLWDIGLNVAGIATVVGAITGASYSDKAGYAADVVGYVAGSENIQEAGEYAHEAADEYREYGYEALPEYVESLGENLNDLWDWATSDDHTIANGSDFGFDKNWNSPGPNDNFLRDNQACKNWGC